MSKHKCRPLIEGTGYDGLIVATATFNDRRVIASGTDWGQVHDAAVRLGHSAPVVMYIPDKLMCLTKSSPSF